MFCPVCKTEYREGFAHCSDCGAVLVTSLPAEPDLDPGSAEVLWAGIDPNILAAIKAALEEAQIPFEDTGQSSPIIFASLRSPHEIWTYKRDHDAAQRVLDSVLAEPSPETEPVAEDEDKADASDDLLEESNERSKKLRYGYLEVFVGALWFVAVIVSVDFFNFSAITIRRAIGLVSALAIVCHGVISCYDAKHPTTPVK